jgi:hypothetical protein
MADEWAVNTPSGQMRLADFTLDQLVELEADCDEQWWQLLSSPFRSARSAKYIYRSACAQMGCEPEVLTVRTITDVFVQVPDDLPDTYGGGLPKAEDDPSASTVGSSSEPAASTGPQPKPEA